MAYNTTASLDKLIHTDFVDFSKNEIRFGQLFSSKKIPSTWIINLKCSKETTTEFFACCKISQWEKQISTKMVELMNQLVIAAENFSEGELLFSVLIPALSTHMDEQLNLVHKVIDVVERANRKICVTLLRRTMDKPESSYAQVQLLAS